MKLIDWLEKNGMSQSQLAEHLNISGPAVSAYCKKGTPPSLANAISIVKLTSGQVSYEELAGIEADQSALNEIL